MVRHKQISLVDHFLGTTLRYTITLTPLFVLPHILARIFFLFYSAAEPLGCKRDYSLDQELQVRIANYTHTNRHTHTHTYKAS